MSTVTNVLAPLQVENSQSVKWDAQCQVLVLGWGAAGACAALQARAEGADVLVADRFTGGGASAKSGGVVYAGGGTRQQRAAGFDDSPDAMFDYLRHETQGVVSDETLRRFCNESVANLEWLEGHGAPYSHEVPPGGKTSYPQDGYYLYYSGNELVPAYGGACPPAPRGHRTRGKGQSGAVLYGHLKSACLNAGVRTLLQAAAKRLVTDSQGRIIGAQLWRLPPGSAQSALHAKWIDRAERLQNVAPGYCDRLRKRAAQLEQDFARPILVHASKGVVLSTGGFIFNRELIGQHAPTFRRNFKVGATGCDGSGLRLGQSVGAASDRLERVSAWRFINPPYSWHKGIVVNTEGRRFCNEEVYGATLGQPLMEEQGGRAWLVLDAPLRKKALREALLGGYWWFQSVPALALMLLKVRKGNSLEDLARVTGMNAAVLQGSVQANNAAARGETGDAFGKSPGGRHALEQGPFYACDISVGNPIFPLGALTLGGLRVDEHSGAVLDQNARPIPGLFAAGRAALGIPSHLYISGLSLADCVFSGRRAGRSAAGETQENRQPRCVDEATS